MRKFSGICRLVLCLLIAKSVNANEPLESENWALMLEYRYQHISNANSAEHNLGINASGPILGVSYLF